MSLRIAYRIKGIRRNLLAALLCSPACLWAQQRPALSLREAFSLAEKNYPQ